MCILCLIQKPKEGIGAPRLGGSGSCGLSLCAENQTLVSTCVDMSAHICTPVPAYTLKAKDKAKPQIYYVLNSLNKLWKYLLQNISSGTMNFLAMLQVIFCILQVFYYSSIIRRKYHYLVIGVQYYVERYFII